MRCQQIEEKLNDYLEGYLNPPEAEAIEKHLQQCSNCRQLFLALQEVRLSLQKMPQITIQHHYEISGKNIKEVIFILHEKIKEFYIWVIPKDNNLIIGSLNKYKMLMEPIVEETLKGLGYDIRLDKIIKKEGYLLALPNQPKDIICSHNNIIFAGESANFVSRKSGKGIYYALISGELAGKYYDSPVLYSNAVKPLMDKLIKKIEEAKSIYL